VKGPYNAQVGKIFRSGEQSTLRVLHVTRRLKKGYAVEKKKTTSMKRLVLEFGQPGWQRIIRL